MHIQLSDHFNYAKLLKFTFPSIVMLVFTSVYGVVDLSLIHIQMCIRDRGYDVNISGSQDTFYAFPDAGQVTAFAETAMQWAVNRGLISGDQGMLNPQGTANRAVTATIMNRFIDVYGR